MVGVVCVYNVGIVAYTVTSSLILIRTTLHIKTSIVTPVVAASRVATVLNVDAAACRNIISVA